jgi:fatty acid desaturase
MYASTTRVGLIQALGLTRTFLQSAERQFMNSQPRPSILKDQRAKRDIALFLAAFTALGISVLLAFQQLLVVPFWILLLLWALVVFAVMDFCIHAWRNYVKLGFFRR